MNDDFTVKLHAYADGELSGDDARSVEAHLETCAACRADLRQIRDLKAAVKRIDWGQAAPQGLADGIRKRVAADRARRAAMWSGGGGLIAASLVAAMLLMRPPVSPVDDVIAGHQRTLRDMPAGIEGYYGDRVKPWLQARLDFAPPVLMKAGNCNLLYARTDRVARQKASALTYMCDGHKVDFYAISGNGRNERSPLVTPHVLPAKGYNVVGWQRGKLTCFAVSDAPAADLLALARYIETHAAEG
ncbi:anti-sigma factor family protein [Asticcacaulis solisilvae]|uniref:anti-sigma factor family protein n=1 Tax=Asticcacaulis solisilvae TaxID=1217274 RepID=UPI003FD6DC04